MKFAKKSLLVLSAVFLSALLIGRVSYAETASSAQGLQISPAKVELNAAKGNSYSIKLNITNVTDSELVYSSAVSDFKASGETGVPKIEIDKTMPATASVRTWVSTISKFTLKSRESKEVNATINVPSNAEPGGHYGILSFSGTAPDVNGTGVGLSASTGVLLLIRVDGQITETAKIASFYSGNLDRPNFFFESSPIPFIVRVQNSGNTHLKPMGNIEIKDMFGNSVATVSVNSSATNVLPKSIRRFGGSDSDKLQMTSKGLMFGKYTAQLTLGYGTTGQALTSTISFWVIPYKLVAIILLVIGTIIYVIKRILKVYNRRIIEQYKNENKSQKRSKKNK